MVFTETGISDIWIIKPEIWGDARGYFAETFKQDLFKSKIGDYNFI